MAKNPAYRLEQRQHISISQYAYDILSNDSITFSGKQNYSGIINTILANFPTDREEDAFSKFADISNDRLSLKIRLQNELADKYHPNGEHNPQATMQIRALVEAYARMTFYKREEIYYRDLIEELNKRIDLKKESEYRNRFIITLKNKQKYYIKPYRISKDYEAPYHYLICMSSKALDAKSEAASFRLSNIQNISKQHKTYGSAKITYTEEELIRNKIASNTVPYLRGETMTFKIELNSSGLYLYNSIFHLRPKYESIKSTEDGKYILTIKATELQIEHYFTNFGEDAIILKPQKMRKKMLDKYRHAYKAYKSNNDNA